MRFCIRSARWTRAGTSQGDGSYLAAGRRPSRKRYGPASRPSTAGETPGRYNGPAMGGTIY